MSTIRIPIDASAVSAEERGKQQVRVAVQSDDRIVSTVIDLQFGKATAELDLDTTGPITIAVGPENTLEADLFRRDTPTVTVRPQHLNGVLLYPVKPIVITLPIWRRWLFWCRTFTIDGRVVGVDGNPVPGAQVSALNVDRFWWWSHAGQVGQTATTDAAGNFRIEFTWCCGWLAWYWWRLREWRLDPVLVEKIQPVLRLSNSLRFDPPGAKLVLGFTELNPQPLPPGRKLGRRPVRVVEAVNPATLPSLRTTLLPLLPAVSEFARWCLWPWCPWTPWFDCTPNLIFVATQNCSGTTKYIVQENVLDARPDTSTELNITLVANSNACTIPPQGIDPVGECFLFTAACYDADQIGATDSGALEGFALPGTEDRPYTGSVNISGQFGYTAAELRYADYYTVYYRPAGSIADFVPVPAAALQPFTRQYFDATKVPPSDWVAPQFSPAPMPISGLPGQFAVVYQSRQSYEISNPAPPNDWGDVLNGQSWTEGRDLIATIETAGFFPDGAYEFEVVAYTLQPDGTLLPNGAPNGCGQPDTNGLNNHNRFTLFFANPAPGETTPDASIDSISFNGSSLLACGIKKLPQGVPFQFAVDFTASDTEGYLDSYSLSLQSGNNLPVPLILAGSPLAGTVSGVVQFGPSYADAMAQTTPSTRPIWKGGAMTLTIPDARSVFPQTCAYDLILTVAKRNIVNCNTDDVFQETAYYSFTVQLE